MSDETQSGMKSALKNKTWIWLVAGFAILVVIGIATS